MASLIHDIFSKKNLNTFFSLKAEWSHFINWKMSTWFIYVYNNIPDFNIEKQHKNIFSQFWQANLN